MRLKSGLNAVVGRSDVLLLCVCNSSTICMLTWL